MITFKLPENFPFEKKPEDGMKERFLIEATYKGDHWDVNTVDGVPMDTAGKANAPGDDGILPDDAAEEADEAMSEGEPEPQPTPTAEMPEQADQSAGPSAGAGFAKAVMNPSQ